MRIIQVKLKNNEVLDLKNFIKIKKVETNNNKEVGLKIFGYRLLGLDGNLFSNSHYKDWDLNGKHILIADAMGFKYSEKVKVNIEDQFRLENPKQRIAEPGKYLFVIFLCESFEADVNPQEVCAILSIAIGKNVIHNYVFDSFHYIKSSGTITTSPINMGKYKERQNVNKVNIELTKTIDRKIYRLDNRNRARIEMSLRWYYKALFEDEIVDAFISYWIAIETVVKEKGSDISIIIGKLKSIYGKEVMEEYENFQVNKLFGIRSAIVHNGKSKSLPLSILEFLNSIYIDLLLYNLNIETEKRLIKFQNKSKLDISKYLVKQNWEKLDHLS